MKFVLLDVKESYSKKGNKFHQAIVIDDMYNTTKLFITESKYQELLPLIGKDVSDRISLIYTRIKNEEYYKLYI